MGLPRPFVVQFGQAGRETVHRTGLHVKLPVRAKDFLRFRKTSAILGRGSPNQIPTKGGENLSGGPTQRGWRISDAKTILETWLVKKGLRSPGLNAIIFRCGVAIKCRAAKLVVTGP